MMTVVWTYCDVAVCLDVAMGDLVGLVYSMRNFILYTYTVVFFAITLVVAIRKEYCDKQFK